MRTPVSSPHSQRRGRSGSSPWAHESSYFPSRVRRGWRAGTVDRMTELPSWASSPGVRASMKSNRGTDTGPELALRRQLHARGLRFFVEPSTPSQPKADRRHFVSPSSLGCVRRRMLLARLPRTSHGRQDERQFWAAKVYGNRKRDAETTHQLEEAGWTVMRVWEHEIATAAADRIERWVRETRAVSRSRSVAAAQRRTIPGTTTPYTSSGHPVVGRPSA